MKNGYVKRVTDDEVIGGVLELHGGPEGVHLAKPEAAGESLSVSKRWLTILFKPIRQDPFKFQVQVATLLPSPDGVSKIFIRTVLLTTNYWKHRQIWYFLSRLLIC